MFEIIKITKEVFVGRMKACCPNKFSDAALSLLYIYLNKKKEEPWTEDDVLIEEKYWCDLYHEILIKEYIKQFPPQEFELNYPIERKILMTNLLRDKFERHEIVGFTETTIIYCG